MKGRQPNPLGESLSTSLSRRQKRGFALAGVILLVVAVAVSVWSLRDAGSYGRSGNGCVNVTMPSTTGGGLMHGCGAAARAMCRDAAAHHDQLALLTRVQCRQAGLLPTAAATP